LVHCRNVLNKEEEEEEEEGEEKSK
jgi:hypothetical protein